MESRVLDQRVHFFEIVAAEKFTKYFRSGIHYLINVLIDRFPILIPLRYYKEWMLSLLESLFELYYLRKYGSTYSEYYYGIKRSEVSDQKQNKNSTTSKNSISLNDNNKGVEGNDNGDNESKASGNNQVNGSTGDNEDSSNTKNYDNWVQESKPISLWKSLLISVILPLVKRSLDMKFEEIRSKCQHDGIESLTTKERIFFKIYPYVNLFIGGINFILNTRYLLDSTFNFYNIQYYILKQKLVKRDQFQDMQDEQEDGVLKTIFKKYFVFVIYIVTKILEWYYGTSQASANIERANEKHVRPPFIDNNDDKENDDNDNSVVNKSNDKFQKGRIGICPICEDMIKQPACLDTSGYVFCENCIIAKVQEIKKCPITSIPSDTNNIHRVYDENSE